MDHIQFFSDQLATASMLLFLPTKLNQIQNLIHNFVYCRYEVSALCYAMFQLTSDCSQAALTQLAYTTLTEHTYSLVANNLTQFIMEEIFYEFGVAYIRWNDEKGNIWEAVKEQVDILGKECFEWDPFENEEQNN